MSASSARRLRERGAAGPGSGGGAAAKPSKALTPISMSGKNPSVGLQRSSSRGKENPRSISRGRDLTEKPTIRPVPRVNKAAASGSVDHGSDGGGRVRWSTSSAPRGRSPSPSELIRVFSDRRVSVGVSGGGKGLESGKQRKGFRDSSVKGSEPNLNRVRVLRDRKESCGVGFNLEKKGRLSEGSGTKVEENKKNLSGISSLENCNGKVDLRLDVKKLGGVDCNFNEKVRNVDEVLKSNEEVGSGIDLRAERSGEISFEDGRVLEIPKEKGLDGNKYPSKLHEKLAFLEGKVKRIASDIKRTKEMLDKNNPDTSKVILTDIQGKISGIQKAMGNVGGDSDGKIELSKAIGDGESGTAVQKKKSKEADNVKSSVKGLSGEELEARLFPHHKLLRNRTSLKATSVGSQSHEPPLEGPTRELEMETKSFSPIDENPIAMEFLACLNEDQTRAALSNQRAGLECCNVQEMDGETSTGVPDCSNIFNGNRDVELALTSDERLDEFDDQERSQDATIGEETEDACIYQLNEVGCKVSTAGWFASEGEAILLAHDDGSCSFYDIVNCEEKAEYKLPPGASPDMWRDCWIVRAPGADGCSGKYVVAASAGDAISPGFCSWDFYTKDVQALQLDGGVNTSRTVLGPLPNNIVHRRNSILDNLVPENQQWWYKPCGPLIISTASCQRGVRIFDIRDGEQIMKWEVQKPTSTMDYSSPLQWRNRGKVVLAEAEAISVWDVNSQSPQALLSVPLFGRKISALHVNNTDGESSGGVRQRVSSSEEGNDGVFCTPDSINILDFRHPSGVGLKIPKLGVSVQSVFSRGDSVFLGCSNGRSGGRKQPSSQVQQFSLRKQRLISTYALPESNSHFHHSAITQVWGNSNLVIGVSALGLFVFDALSEDPLQSFGIDSANTQNVRDVIGPDDMYSPSFDYSSSRALIISRDRPAMWRRMS